VNDHTPEPIVDDASRAAHGSVPEDRVLASLAGGFPTVAFARFEPLSGPVQDVAHVPADVYTDFVAAARNAGFDAFVDLCGVDYLRRRPRYEVVVTLLSYARAQRVRIRVGVDGGEPTIGSITPIFAGANFYERETYDLFGIQFTGHPDLTRILLPDDWEGYPLRKDYAVGSVPVQFKGAHQAS
jgi:NADH-quinone oxidoreductase subunit C